MTPSTQYLFTVFFFYSLHRTEVRSTFNLWVSLLSETRKMSRERAAFAEVMASEMTSRLDIMSKDVQMLTRKVGIVQ